MMLARARSGVRLARVIVACAVLGYSLHGPVAEARDPTAAERAALEARVAAFTKTVDDKRYADMLDEMPPKLFDVFVKRTGLPVDQLRTLMRAQIDQVMKTGSIDSFTLDLSSAQFRSLPSGTIYAFIPTTTTMTMGSQRMTARSSTLALRDNDNWHLVRVAAAQVPILRETYPEFADVEFPKDSLEMKP